MNLWVFLRHGESEANKARRFSGHKDVALTEFGCHQARTAGAELRTLLKHQRLWAAFSSDLQRARDTARLALEAASIEVPLTEHAALRERCLGAWEGQAIDAIRNSDDGKKLISWNGHAPGGESLADVANRAVELLSEIQPQGPVLIVAHGGLIRALLGLIDGTPLDEIGQVNIPNAVPIAREINSEQWAEISTRLSG